MPSASFQKSGWPKPSAQPAPGRRQARSFLHRLNAALDLAFGIVLALSSQQVAIHRLRQFDQGEQPNGSRREGAVGEQTAHQAVVP